MTRHLEDAVRAAASALRAAIADAEAAGLAVTLPRRAADLGAIAISATARVGPATGVALVGIDVPADGVEREYFLDGRAPDLTEEERAALPRLEPEQPNEPSDFVVGTTRRRRRR